jgi:threonine/homoserine/homoserine lactone efflux protein
MLVPLGVGSGFLYSSLSSSAIQWAEFAVALVLMICLEAIASFLLILLPAGQGMRDKPTLRKWADQTLGASIAAQE